MTKSERTIELSGAEWVGVQAGSRTAGGPLVMFRDPVTGSTLALPDDEALTVQAVIAKMKSSREKFFGVNS